MFWGKINKKVGFLGDFMFEKRTDLALEVHELHGRDSGITVREENIDGIVVTRAEIEEGEGVRLSGKSAGKYITFDVGAFYKKGRESLVRASSLIADEMKKLFPNGDSCFLVVGLGNEQITPDSVGPRAVKKLLVTRHIQSIDKPLFDNAGFGCLAAISPGVLGQTGVESLDIIAGVVKKINPVCVIIIDSLASRRLARLATTVQLSNVGISPGSGVANHRAELSEETLGVPVISIGIPTVVDAATLAYDLLEERFGEDDPSFSETVEKLFSGGKADMFVTPKDNDVIAEHSATLIASAINIAVHDMTDSEINEFLS